MFPARGVPRCMIVSGGDAGRLAEGRRYCAAIFARRTLPFDKVEGLHPHLWDCQVLFEALNNFRKSSSGLFRMVTAVSGM
jgi:hypothetical protein